MSAGRKGLSRTPPLSLDLATYLALCRIRHKANYVATRIVSRRVVVRRVGAGSRRGFMEGRDITPVLVEG
jgi:hypothetical protein